MLCVRFGMVDDNLDMEELINLVTSAGQELEESSKVINADFIIIYQVIEIKYMSENCVCVRVLSSIIAENTILMSFKL